MIIDTSTTQSGTNAGPINMYVTTFDQPASTVLLKAEGNGGGNGGTINVQTSSGDFKLSNTGPGLAMDASADSNGGNGGTIQLTTNASDVAIAGANVINASAAAGGNGSISLEVNSLNGNGDTSTEINADGFGQGGTIEIDASGAIDIGGVTAAGTGGAGGEIDIDGSSVLIRWALAAGGTGFQGNTYVEAESSSLAVSGIITGNQNLIANNDLTVTSSTEADLDITTAYSGNGTINLTSPGPVTIDQPNNGEATVSANNNLIITAGGLNFGDGENGSSYVYVGGNLEVITTDPERDIGLGMLVEVYGEESSYLTSARSISQLENGSLQITGSLSLTAEGLDVGEAGNPLSIITEYLTASAPNGIVNVNVNSTNGVEVDELTAAKGITLEAGADITVNGKVQVTGTDTVNIIDLHADSGFVSLDDQVPGADLITNANGSIYVHTVGKANLGRLNRPLLFFIA